MSELTTSEATEHFCGSADATPRCSFLKTHSAYAELCLWPPQVFRWLNTIADHCKQVSEQRGDIWVTAATFSTDHSVTHRIFYCLSHALCLFMKDRKKIAGLSQPLSLGSLHPSECTRALQHPPEQTAPAERLGLVYSFLWPTLIILPITMASECLPERLCMMISVHLS